jgi:hypothetical protein
VEFDGMVKYLLPTKETNLKLINKRLEKNNLTLTYKIKGKTHF